MRLALEISGRQPWQCQSSRDVAVSIVRGREYESRIHCDGDPDAEEA